MKQQKSGSGEFKKEIGLFGGMSVICGIMIGSGIFYLGSYVLQRSGYSLGLALICWLLGGLVSLLEASVLQSWELLTRKREASWCI